MLLDRSKFIHYQNSNLSSTVREIVFGLEDGMVSTLGAVTGVATATHDQFSVLLTGLVISNLKNLPIYSAVLGIAFILLVTGAVILLIIKRN